MSVYAEIFLALHISSILNTEDCRVASRAAPFRQLKFSGEYDERGVRT